MANASMPGPETMTKPITTGTGLETPFAQAIVGGQIPKTGQPTGSIIPKP